MFGESAGVVAALDVQADGNPGAAIVELRPAHFRFDFRCHCANRLSYLIINKRFVFRDDIFNIKFES